MESATTYRASRTGQTSFRRIPPVALRRRPRATAELLEPRRLLSITPAEYSDICTLYPQFSLPEDITQINLIEITPDQLAAPNLQSAIAAAASTTLPDLVVLRTTDTQNTITYTSPSDQLAIDIPSTQGAISIIGHGSQPLTLDANNQCGVVTIGSDGSTTIVALGGMVLTHGHATSGGGLSQHYGSMTLTNMTISDNTANPHGGGVYAYGTSTLTNVTISGNTASHSGGGVYQDGGSLTLTSVTVKNNTASGYGGGVYAYGTSTLTNVTISGNTASHSGGGVYQDGGSSTLTNVTISRNVALGGDGGGIYQFHGTSSLIHLVISGNTAGRDGGGLCMLEGSCTLSDVTIGGNTARAGGGVCQLTGTLTLDNTIVAMNMGPWGSDVQQGYGAMLSGAHNLIGDGSGQIALRNRVHGNLVGTFNNPIDPQFVNISGSDWTTWDLHLQATSPAIDKGSNSLIPEGVRTDLAGKPRIVGRSVDIGAYETQTRASAVSISINGGAAQRSMVKKIVVVFHERVTLDDGAVTVLLSSGEAVPDTIFEVRNPCRDKKRYVIAFRGDGVIGGSLADGVYDLVVHGEYVHDKAGNTLTGDYTRSFHRLFGDADGNGTVNAADSRQLQIACSPFGHRLRTIFDFDGNGILTRRDLLEFLQRYGSGV